MGYRTVKSDVFKMTADALVVSVLSNKPYIGCGLDREVFNRAGEDAMLARSNYEFLCRGDAVIIPAFNLTNYKFLILVVPPLWEGGDNNEGSILRSCYENAIQVAKNKKLKSIVFPMIATGLFQYPPKKAREEAEMIIQNKLGKRDNLDVTLVEFSDKDKEDIANDKKILDDFSYKDFKNYDKILAKLKKTDFYEDPMFLLEHMSYLNSCRAEKKEKEKRSSNKKGAEKSSIEEVKDKTSFTNLLDMYLANKGMSKGKLAELTGISRSTFTGWYDLRRETQKRAARPRRENLLKVVLALELSFDQASELIRIGCNDGDPFPNGDRENIIYDFILRNNYNTWEIDEELEINNFDLLYPDEESREIER